MNGRIDNGALGSAGNIGDGRAGERAGSKVNASGEEDIRLELLRFLLPLLLLLLLRFFLAPFRLRLCSSCDLLRLCLSP